MVPPIRIHRLSRPQTLTLNSQHNRTSRKESSPSWTKLETISLSLLADNLIPLHHSHQANSRRQ
jgi:hypothetical protein